VYKALLVSLLFLMSLKLTAFILMLISFRLYCFSATVDLLAPSGVCSLADVLAIATNVHVVAQCLCLFCCLNTVLAVTGCYAGGGVLIFVGARVLAITKVLVVAGNMLLLTTLLSRAFTPIHYPWCCWRPSLLPRHV